MRSSSLTMRALRVLQMADVVIYDAVVPQSVVDLARREAERICGGSGDAEALKLARAGKRVVCLRVADCLDAESERIAAHGVAFEVVSGLPIPARSA